MCKNFLIVQQISVDSMPFSQYLCVTINGIAILVGHMIFKLCFHHNKEWYKRTVQLISLQKNIHSIKLNDGVPLTDSGVWIEYHLIPVLATRFIANTTTNQNSPHHIIPGETIILHHYQLHGYTLNISLIDLKVKRVVEDWNQSVFLDC